MNNLISYIKDSFDEVMNKVTWPKYEELQSTTGLVLVASAIFGVTVFLIDLMFETGLGYIVK